MGTDNTKNIGIIISNASLIEKLLMNKLGATGIGLIKKLAKVESKVDPSYAKDIRSIAELRNRAAHTSDFSQYNLGSYIIKCDRVIAYLTAYGLPNREVTHSTPATKKKKKGKPKVNNSSQSVPQKKNPPRSFAESLVQLCRNTVLGVAGLVMVSMICVGLIIGYKISGIGSAILGCAIGGAVGYIAFEIIRQVGHGIINIIQDHFHLILTASVIIFAIVFFWGVKIDLRDQTFRDSWKALNSQLGSLDNNVKSTPKDSSGAK